MEWLVASLLGVIAALVFAHWLLIGRLRRVEMRQGEMLGRMNELESAVIAIRRRAERIEAAADYVASANGCEASSQDPLLLIEQLADPAALLNDSMLENAAKQIGGVPNGVAADFFEIDCKVVAISRLIENGHPLPEI